MQRKRLKKAEAAAISATVIAHCPAGDQQWSIFDADSKLDCPWGILSELRAFFWRNIFSQTKLSTRKTDDQYNAVFKKLFWVTRILTSLKIIIYWFLICEWFYLKNNQPRKISARSQKKAGKLFFNTLLLVTKHF